MNKNHKCLNEKRRRQCEIRYLDELAGLISASASDMCSLSASAKPDKCAILQETVNQVRQIKLEECGSSDVLQQSEVSSSKPSILASDVLGSVLLKALDGFLFMVNTDGKIEFVSENVKSFLKYDQESLVDKSIYNIIPVGDHARFSSNLLPMSIGNGLGWSPEPNATVSKSRTFNCRFLIKPPDDQEETMEDKQQRVQQYENMQIAAVLLPFTGEKNENDINCEVQNHLVCVARRIPSNEKSSSSTVEQFTTRLDMTGKILTVDTSGVSAVYSQYLNKELVGHIIQELCHPNDFQKLNQHLKETLQLGSNTSGVYRLRIAQDKYIQVQTKSKRFSYNPMANEQEFIVATHSIIRDNDHHPDVSATATQHCNQPSSNASLNSALSNNVNGGSYSYQSLSPQDFTLNDLDLFQTSSWDLTTDGAEVNETTNMQTSLSGPSRPESTSSVVSVTQRTQSHPGSAFNTEFISGRGSPSIQSPTQLSSTSSPRPGSVTSFTNTFPFSPGPPQPLSQTSSPAPALIKREDLSTSNLELSNLSPVSSLMSENQGSSNPAQKLRNLLTHGIEEADSSVPKNSTLGNPNVEGNISSDNETNSTCANADSASSRNENIILRELLNQEDEDEGNDEGVNNATQMDAHVSNSSTPMDICSNEALQKRTINNNNMLRKLLNSEDDEKGYKKSPDMLIQQLLKTEGKVADSSMASSVKASAAALSSTLVDALATAKRKSPDAPSESSASKRQNLHNIQHAHLAGQNPMLASMLAQTPRTAPSVPTSIANAIVSQLPQERLPKNLEKKLVHTPYTGTSTPNPSSNNQQYIYSQIQGPTRSLLSTSLQQEVVTADSRGHVTLAPQNSSTPPFQQTQGFLGKLLPPLDGSQGTVNVYEGQFAHNSEDLPALQSGTSTLFAGLSSESNSSVNVAPSDPDLAEILDQVWSMEQDLNMDSTSSEDLALYNLLEEIPAPAPAASPRPPSGHEEDSKTAIINAIQRQLMSCEVTNASASSGNNPQFSQATTPTLTAISSHLTPNAFSQVNHYQAAPPAYSVSAAAPGQRTRTPTLHSVQTGASPSTQQIMPISNQRQAVPQFLNVAELSPQIRRQLIERKQKLMHQHTQRRLLMQKQQLAMRAQQTLAENLPPSTPSSFQENLNDALSTSVVPNVSLQQRATNVPEQQLSPRFSAIPQLPGSIGQPSSPSQLSPGQRQQPSFPQLPQPTYPNNYPQARLSPHITSPPQQAPTQSWVQRTSQNAANLQQQNPMLNAQLSQGSFTNQTQSRFPNQTQQPRQVIVRSLPSPNPRNSPYSNSPDSPFHPPSPGVSLYQQPAAAPQSQQPQQRLQRAVSVPSRVNSPRSLQAGYVGTEPLLSPQPSPGNYNASNYNNSIAVSTSSGYNPDNFGFDQQIYPAASVDRSRGSGNSMTSEYVRQELRAMVGARTQQQQQQQQHHQVHQQLVPQLSQASISQSANQSFSQSDFEALSFSLELGSDGQQSSSSLFSQSILNVTGGSDNHSRTNSPRFQIEEHRPAEKKSLLQQLLSEPP